MTREEVDHWIQDPIFEAMYNNAMGEGGDGSALLICVNAHNNPKYDYKYLADRFEKFLTDKKDFVVVAKLRNEEHKSVGYEGLPNGKTPTERYEMDFKGNKIIGFSMFPETAFVFQEGKTKNPGPQDDWHSIIITL